MECDMEENREAAEAVTTPHFQTWNMFLATGQSSGISDKNIESLLCTNMEPTLRTRSQSFTKKG